MYNFLTKYKLKNINLIIGETGREELVFNQLFNIHKTEAKQWDFYKNRFSQSHPDIDRLNIKHKTDYYRQFEFFYECIKEGNIWFLNRLDEGIKSPSILNEIVELLEQDFPEKYFVILTNSPLIISKVKRTSIIHVDFNNNQEIECYHPIHSYAYNLELIYNYIFNLSSMPKSIESKINRIYSFSPEESLNNLKNLIGKDHPEIIKLELYIKRKNEREGNDTSVI
jgi:hypothetical protein